MAASSPIPWKKTLIAIVKIAVSVAILAWLFNKAQQDNQFTEIASREKNWLWLATALTLVLLGHMISFVRWRMLVNALDIPFNTFDAIRIGLVGVFFALFAFGLVGGDSLRIYYATRDAKQKLAEVVCSVFTDRAIGMLVMFSIATVGFLFVDINVEGAEHPEKLTTIRYLCMLISLATAIGWAVVVAFLFSPSILSAGPIDKLKNLPGVGNIIKQFSEVILLYRKRVHVLWAAVAWSVAVNLCFIGAIYLIAVGLNVTHPPLVQHFVIAPISTAANAIPFPGGLGGMEFVLSYFYDAVSSVTSQTEHGIAVAFAFRIALLLIAAFGAIAWFANRKVIRDIVDSSEKQAE